MKNARALQRAGVESFRRGEYRDCVAALSAALRAEPGLREARLFRGAARRMLGDHAAALRDVRAAKAGKPSAAVLFAAAVLAADMGEPEAALTDAQAARRLAPRSPEIRGLLERLSRPRLYPAVAVDARLELLGVLLNLIAARQTVVGFAADPETDYGRRTRERFRRFAKHRAVGALSKALRSELTVIGAQRSMLHVGEPPDLVPDEGRVRRPELLRLMGAFARDADFADFFTAQRAFYDRCRAGVVRQMRGRDYAGVLEAYTGRPVTARYTLILCPQRAVLSGGNLNHLARDARGFVIHSAVGPTGAERGAPTFDFPALRWDIWHELCHAFLDPLFKEDGEGPWEHSVREHMAQGTAMRVLHWARETGRAEGTPVPARGHEYPLLGAIQERLRVYEKNRRTYPTIDAFYGRLMAVLKPLPRSKASRPGRDDGII